MPKLAKLKDKFRKLESEKKVVFIMQEIYWYFQFTRNASKIKESFYHGSSKQKYLKDSFIYVADGNYPIGGLADRLRGIMELYNWCQCHNRDFRIRFTDPFNLQDYLLPNNYQWTIDEQQFSYNPKEAEPVLLLSSIDMSKHFRQQADRFFNFCMRAHSIRTKKQLHIISHMEINSYDWVRCYHDLFKPAPTLLDRIEYHKQAIGGKYISVSFRFTTLLGDLVDCVNSELSDPEKRELIDRCKDEILKIESENPDVEHVLVASDSVTFVNEAKLLPKVYVVPGEIRHIDRERDIVNDDATMKTFLDLYMIMGAEKSYLVKFGNMYESKFPYLACKVSGRELLVRTDN